MVRGIESENVPITSDMAQQIRNSIIRESSNLSRSELVSLLKHSRSKVMSVVCRKSIYLWKNGCR